MRINIPPKMDFFPLKRYMHDYILSFYQFVKFQTTGFQEVLKTTLYKTPNLL